MTLAQLATEVMARLNLSSTESSARVKRELNDAYRRLTSSCGLATSRRTTANVNSVALTPTVTFALDKVERVYITSPTKQVFPEITYDDCRNANIETATTGIPSAYAIKTMGGGDVTIELTPIPDGAYMIYADGYVTVATLADNDEPVVPTDYQDALIYDVLRVEYMKLDKRDLSQMSLNDYENRVAQLRYFIAKSNSLTISQGGRSGLGGGAYWPGRRWNAMLRRW